MKEHPGSSAHEIANEPEWQSSHHHHRVGFKNRDHRLPGITSEREQYDREIKQAVKDLQYLHDETTQGKLVNFRDIIERQPVAFLSYSLCLVACFGSNCCTGLPSPSPAEPVTRVEICAGHNRGLGEE